MRIAFAMVGDAKVLFDGMQHRTRALAQVDARIGVVFLQIDSRFPYIWQVRS
jgi:hypothetical protein